MKGPSEDSISFKPTASMAATPWPSNVLANASLLPLCSRKKTGGSGVTPFVQALHAILGTPEDKTEVTLLASHRTRADALAVEAFDAWAAASKGRLRAITTLTREPANSAWAGRRAAP